MQYLAVTSTSWWTRRCSDHTEKVTTGQLSVSLTTAYSISWVAEQANRQRSLGRMILSLGDLVAPGGVGYDDQRAAGSVANTEYTRNTAAAAATPTVACCHCAAQVVSRHWMCGQDASRYTSNASLLFMYGTKRHVVLILEILMTK